MSCCFIRSLIGDDSGNLEIKHRGAIYFLCPMKSRKLISLLGGHFMWPVTWQFTHSKNQTFRKFRLHEVFENTLQREWQRVFENALLQRWQRVIWYFIPSFLCMCLDKVWAVCLDKVCIMCWPIDRIVLKFIKLNAAERNMANCSSLIVL